MSPAAQDGTKKRHLSLIARTGVAIVAIVWVFRDQNWAELAAVFRRLNPAYFALSLGVFLVAQGVIAFRWWLLLRAQTIHIRLPAVMRLHFLGLFYNNVMPGSVGGDLLKGWYVTKHTEKRLEGALSVLVDRLVGLGGMVLMAAVAYVFFLRGQAIEVASSGPGDARGWFADHRMAILWLVVAILAGVALLLLYPASRARIRRAGALLLHRGSSILARIKQALVVYCSKPVTMLCALILTIIAQSIVIMAFWLLGRNLGIAGGLKYYFVIFPVTWIVAAVPVSIAGLGVLEAGMVELFTRLVGATGESALALAFCQRFVWVLASLPGGGVHLMGAHLPKDFFVDAENHLN